MPYKIIVNGVPIEAESGADAIALAEMIARASAKPAPEPKVVEPKPPAVQPRNGQSWPLPGVEKAPAAVDPAPAPTAAKHTGRNGAPLGERAEAALAATALAAIQAGGTEGTASTTLQPILGGDLIAVGSKMRPVKRVIQRLGLEPDEVYVQERVDNRSMWFPGPKIDEAVQKALEAAKKK